MKKRTQKKKNTPEDFLRDILITQLGLAGLTQHQIRQIAGCDMKYVTRILKHFKKLKQKQRSE
jgi:hypothetical protein